MIAIDFCWCCAQRPRETAGHVAYGSKKMDFYQIEHVEMAAAVMNRAHVLISLRIDTECEVMPGTSFHYIYMYIMYICARTKRKLVSYINLMVLFTCQSPSADNGLR